MGRRQIKDRCHRLLLLGLPQRSQLWKMAIAFPNYRSEGTNHLPEIARVNYTHQSSCSLVIERVFKSMQFAAKEWWKCSRKFSSSSQNSSLHPWVGNKGYHPGTNWEKSILPQRHGKSRRHLIARRHYCRGTYDQEKLWIRIHYYLFGQCYKFAVFVRQNGRLSCQPGRREKAAIDRLIWRKTSDLHIHRIHPMRVVLLLHLSSKTSIHPGLGLLRVFSSFHSRA